MARFPNIDIFHTGGRNKDYDWIIYLTLLLVFIGIYAITVKTGDIRDYIKRRCKSKKNALSFRRESAASIRKGDILPKMSEKSKFGLI